MRTSLAGVFLVGFLALGGCSGDEGGKDAGPDQRPDGPSDVVKDGVDDTSPADGAEDHAGMIQAYQTPGCGAAAVAVWTKPGLGNGGAMACSYCLCTGTTVSNALCNYSEQPYSAKGPCPDGGGQ